MKKISFTKMSGAGNDFIIIEAGRGLNYKKLALTMCQRTSGLGADGLLILDKSSKADYKMRIINADGSEAEMCGNGVRCLAAYIVHYKKLKKKLFSIETKAGIILAEPQSRDLMRVRLSDPSGYKKTVPLTINKRKLSPGFINTGVPHTIVFVKNLSAINVDAIGRVVRFHKSFQPKGTNVNFVEQTSPSLIEARTYERGVEGETQACGTGSVACALVTYLRMHPDTTNKTKARMRVKTKSKETLEITFDINNGCPVNVWLKGSTRFIAKGDYYV